MLLGFPASRSGPAHLGTWYPVGGRAIGVRSPPYTTQNATQLESRTVNYGLGEEDEQRDFVDYSTVIVASTILYTVLQNTEE